MGGATRSGRTTGGGVTQDTNPAQLESALLAAHSSGDSAALVELYSRAAKLAQEEQDTDRAGFYLTHAWIFALECGHCQADALREDLRAQGRVD